jgi:hypothetical protein
MREKKIFKNDDSKILVLVETKKKAEAFSFTYANEAFRTVETLSWTFFFVKLSSGMLFACLHWSDRNNRGARRAV